MLSSVFFKSDKKFPDWFEMKNSELLEEAYWKDNSIIMSPFGGGLRGGKLYKL